MSKQIVKKLTEPETRESRLFLLKKAPSFQFHTITKIPEATLVVGMERDTPELQEYNPHRFTHQQSSNHL